MAILGVDIGGTKIETCIFDQALQPVERWRVDTPTLDYQHFLDTVKQQVLKADELAGEILPVGLGMPGLINNKGQVLSANVPCATDKFIAEDLMAILNRPVAIENDTRCFALSEARGGAGHGYPRVFGAILGTGAAGGLCVEGKLTNGQQGIAGEYGHLPLSASLQQKYQLPVLTCGCGLVGCVESYVAGPGVERLSQHISGKAISGKAWSQQLKNQDPQAQLVLECLLDILGETFASLSKLLEPDVIVLGGGLSLVPQLIDGLEPAIKQHLFAGFEAPIVVKARFGDSSGVRGAALLAG